MSESFFSTTFPCYQHLRIEWTISNFSKELLRDSARFLNKLIDSPDFPVTVDMRGTRKFRLTLEKNQSLLSCYLSESSPYAYGIAKRKLCFFYKIGIADAYNYSEDASWKSEGKVFIEHSYDHERLCKLFNYKDLATGYREERYIRGKKLKIIVRLSVMEIVNIPCVPKTMSEQFEKLFNNEKFSDFTLVTSDEKEIPVHKSVLSVRSAVFETMMETNMRENSEKRAKIEDISAPAFLEFLRFIYCGNVEGIDEHAVELLYAATKYDIQDLKPFCVKSLAENLSITNAIETTMLADLHEEKKLKRYCIDFIDWNYTEMKDLEGWKIVPQSLFKEILDKVANRDHKDLFLDSKIATTVYSSTTRLNATVPLVVPAAVPAPVVVPAARPAQ